MWDLYVFDGIEAATAAVGSKYCAQIFVLDLAPSLLQISMIPMIFCRHIPWMVLVCNAKYRPNCSNPVKWWPFLIKSIKFLHFSPNIFWLCQQNLIWTLLGVKGALSGNITSIDFDLAKWWQMAILILCKCACIHACVCACMYACLHTNDRGSSLKTQS